MLQFDSNLLTENLLLMASPLYMSASQRLSQQIYLAFKMS